MPELSSYARNSATAAQFRRLAGTDTYVSPADYGLIADGSAHALSSLYGSLGDAQDVYPFVTDLSQQIDWAACKMASNVAFGEDGSEHANSSELNKRIHLPGGNYRFGDDTWTIRNLASARIEGDGKLVTNIRGNNTILQFDGVWYTRLEGFALLAQTDDAIAALDIDGNVPGHPYATRGVQGLTLIDLLIDGGNSTYAFSLGRQGGGSAQGSECKFINIHLSQASFACYYQSGFNALANTFDGGNIQNYTKHGAYIIGGTIGFIKTGFQSTQGYRQIENDGWDILIGEAGAYEGSFAYGCRSESLRQLRNAGAVRFDMRACVARAAVGGWFASTAYGPVAAAYKAIIETSADGRDRLYVATTPGTTGSSKPTFPNDGGTVADGSVVWTETPFNSVENLDGSIDLPTCAFYTGGDIVAPARDTCRWTDEDTMLSVYDDTIVADATAANIILTTDQIFENAELGVWRGKTFTIRKCDTSAHTVVIKSGYNAATIATIAGGAVGYRTIVYSDGAGGTRSWQLIGSS